MLTGWFSEFAARDRMDTTQPVTYGSGPARFAGATYDPTSHYRAAAVFAFHRRIGLGVGLLRAVSQHQVSVLQTAVEALDAPRDIAEIVDMPPARRGGFLAIRSPRVAELCTGLHERGVFTDSRGTILRMGPAPYLSDDQLQDSVARLGEAIRALVRPT